MYTSMSLRPDGMDKGVVAFAAALKTTIEILTPRVTTMNLLRRQENSCYFLIIIYFIHPVLTEGVKLSLVEVAEKVIVSELYLFIAKYVPFDLY